MARRKKAAKREILPDPVYHSQKISRFTNVVMKSGKKSVAEQIVYGALEEVAKRSDKSALADISKSSNISENPKLRDFVLDIFAKAIDNVGPSVEVRSRRVGGANYQVPVEVRADRRLALAMRNLVGCASLRGEKTMVLRLAAEILDAFFGRGAAVKKREDMHKMAKANQAFAHYRW